MKKIRGPVIFLFACAVAVLALPGSAVYAQQAPDHHKCYDVVPWLLPIPRDVLLTDQFGEVQGHVERGVKFSPPVAKQLPGGEYSPIMNPEDHLTWYELMTMQPTEPRHLLVSNQFGADQEMTVGAPRYLLLPAWKLYVNGQPTGLDHPQGLNHYLCYDVIEGPPIGLEGVTLSDQFDPFHLPPGPEHVTVGAPVVFCNPVQKTVLPGGVPFPILDPENHLACYDIAPHEPLGPLIVVANDQFGDSMFMVLENQFLCAPSTKILCTDNDGDGHIDQNCGGDDCDDNDPTVYPGAPQICDGKDNPCVIYPAVPANESDDDSDGYVECSPWVGTVPGVVGGGDCNDGKANIYPGNANANCDCTDPIPQGTPESAAAGNCADGADNDCDTLVDTDPECTGGSCTGSAEASTYEVSPVYGSSGLSKHLAYFLLPLGALLTIGIWRRKR